MLLSGIIPAIPTHNFQVENQPEDDPEKFMALSFACEHFANQMLASSRTLSVRRFLRVRIPSQTLTLSLSLSLSLGWKLTQTLLPS